MATSTTNPIEYAGMSPDFTCRIMTIPPERNLVYWLDCEVQSRLVYARFPLPLIMEGIGPQWLDDHSLHEVNRLVENDAAAQR